jgi:hypothetical protein
MRFGISGTLAVFALVAAASITVPACKMTKNADGSYTAEFAPDMVITAWGLESALNQLIDLYRNCLAGTWNRPCTRLELWRIDRAINGVIEKKAALDAGTS